MVYLTAYRNTTLCALHVVITITFFTTFLAHLDVLSELLPGIFHILVGLMTFYHAVASLTTAFTGHALFPLGSALLHHRANRAHSKRAAEAVRQRPWPLMREARGPAGCASLFGLSRVFG